MWKKMAVVIFAVGLPSLSWGAKEPQVNPYIFGQSKATWEPIGDAFQRVAGGAMLIMAAPVMYDYYTGELRRDPRKFWMWSVASTLVPVIQLGIVLSTDKMSLAKVKASDLKETRGYYSTSREYREFLEGYADEYKNKMILTLAAGWAVYLPFSIAASYWLIYGTR